MLDIRQIYKGKIVKALRVVEVGIHERIELIGGGLCRINAESGLGVQLERLSKACALRLGRVVARAVVPGAGEVVVLVVGHGRVDGWRGGRGRVVVPAASAIPPASAATTISAAVGRVRPVAGLAVG